MDTIWQCHPDAERLIEQILDKCCSDNEDLAHLKGELHRYTSTRLFDWIDHVYIGSSPEMDHELRKCGFEQEQTRASYRVFFHPGAQLPRIVVFNEMQARHDVAVLVESIADFLCVRGLSKPIEGAPLSAFRSCMISSRNRTTFWVVERRGTLSIEPAYPPKEDLDHVVKAMELWQTRPRNMEDEDQCMNLTIELAQNLVSLVGQDMAASIVLECERKYWQSRNVPGQLQKNRQDKVGMGWANHDHHTFRSSRKRFSSLVRLFEILGFHCRERYYAGEEAGWGAQIMENPRGKFVLFLDVDLGADEVSQEFAHEPLPELKSLGTIGLWCALHGDSILKAGMHHLEAQFFFDDLKKDLSEIGVQMMEPFSSFPFLKQAFTRGEIWHVEPARVYRLLEKELITKAQADQFLTHGTVGSHLENLQRREGYKGFNQKNVSKIIKSTDPRIISPSM
jgi:hypothetical protein